MAEPALPRRADVRARRHAILRASVRTAVSVTVANIAGAFLAIATLSLVERPEQIVFAWGNGVLAAMFAGPLAAAVGLVASFAGWVIGNVAILVRPVADLDTLLFVLTASASGAVITAVIASTLPINVVATAVVEGAGIGVAAVVSFSLATKRPPHPEGELA